MISSLAVSPLRTAKKQSFWFLSVRPKNRSSFLSVSSFSFDNLGARMLFSPFARTKSVVCVKNNLFKKNGWKIFLFSPWVVSQCLALAFERVFVEKRQHKEMSIFFFA